MSQNTLYYGEIVARIAIKLSTLNHANDNRLPPQKNITLEDMICDLSADSGRIFDRLEDLSGEHFIDWLSALENYSDALCSFISDGRIPTTVDMISMASKSIEASRAKRLQDAKRLL